MVSPSHGNHFSRDSVFERVFLIGRGFKMISSKKRIRRILKPTVKEMEK
jgi:hypothetical protein